MTTLPLGPRVPILALLALTTGCSGKAVLRGLPADAGTAVEYHAPAAVVADLTPKAIQEVGYGSLEPETRDSASLVLLASTGWSFSSWGEALRVRVDHAGPDRASVRVAGRPNNPMDWSGRVNRHAVEFVHELDQLVGPDALRAVPGMKVRGLLESGERIQGEVVAGKDGSLLVREGRVEPRPLSHLSAPEVYRGGWGQGRTGLAVGLMAGLIATYAIALNQCPLITSDPCETSSKAFLAIPLGGLLGWAVGKTFRTERWSPIDGGR